MSFAGHVLDMIQRARQNSALLKSKKARLRRVKEAHIGIKSGTSLTENDIKLTQAQLNHFKKELNSKLKAQRKNEIYLFPLLLICNSRILCMAFILTCF